MKNIADNTFLIPLRIDAHIRIENVLLVTEFLITHFDTNIKVLECAPYNNGLLEKLLHKTIEYSFKEDNDPIFYRTKYINLMARTTVTPYIAVWDADVIAPVTQIEKSIELLRNGEADFVYPYEKLFLDTTPILRKLFLQEGRIEVLEQNTKKMKEMYIPDPVGGGFMANLNAYKHAGLENENFYGWGPEDHERFHRWENLGCKIKRIPGHLFHLSHGRGINSSYHNADQQMIKFKEINYIRRNKSLDCLQSTEEQNTI